MKSKPTIPRTRARREFGDFQTPPALAERICAFLRTRGASPQALVEPNCGVGSLLLAALRVFPSLKTAIGLDIREDYIRTLLDSLKSYERGAIAKLECADFFGCDWRVALDCLPEPILVLGNPPWVTNSALGAIDSSNLPEKSNFQGHAGLDALTGKSNFDIWEWMLIRLAEALCGRNATLAMLCKTAVARKVLRYAWKNSIDICGAELRLIDSQRYFGAAVDACLLVCSFATDANTKECAVFNSLDDVQRSKAFGFQDGRLVSDAAALNRLRHLEAASVFRWRSGIKHDCSKVMTFVREGGKYRNGLGKVVELEIDYLFPMLRSSEIAKGMKTPSRWMLVPQSHPTDDTSAIESRATEDLGVPSSRRGSIEGSRQLDLPQPTTLCGLWRWAILVCTVQSRNLGSLQEANLCPNWVL